MTCKRSCRVYSKLSHLGCWGRRFLALPGGFLSPSSESYKMVPKNGATITSPGRRAGFCREGWKAAGFTSAEVPQTFTVSLSGTETPKCEMLFNFKRQHWCDHERV